MPRATFLFALTLTCLAHMPVLSADFVYEDRNWIDVATNPASDPTWPTLWQHPLTAASAQGLVWRVDRALSGNRPWAYHASNVVIHLINGLLVYAVVASLATSEIATVVMALFLLHPLQSEAVDYATSTGELTAITCVLLAMWSATRRHLLWLSVAGLCAVVALATKASVGVTLVALIPLTAWMARSRWRWLSIGLASGVCLAGLAQAAWFLRDASVQPMAAWSALTLRNIAAWMHDARQVLLPIGLSVDPAVASGPMLAMLVAGWLACWGLAWALSRTLPIAAFGLTWALLAPLPRMLSQSSDLLKEHHFYGAMPGLILCLVVVASSLSRRIVHGTALSKLALS